MTEAGSNTRRMALGRTIRAVGSADFMPSLMLYLAEVTPFQGCLLLLLDGTAPPRHIYDDVRAERRTVVIDRYLDGAYLLDPFFTHYRQGGDPGAFRLRDVAPDRFQQSTYHKTYYRSIRLVDEAAILSPLPDGRTVFTSIGRREDAKRFSRRDIARFQDMLPIYDALLAQHFSHPRQDLEPDDLPRDIDEVLVTFDSPALTRRERDIAALILKGHSTASIAVIAGIAEGTVKIHRKNIYRKLGISSQGELFSLFLSRLGRR
ncbi:helix-turn-helix transcriptional regulator [Oceanomicrobium pacificus]|uniref:HTH luxR-type domain-containing protein n=1 Tax=Oceanomicrobium pacificus TaxID=2692916 RepID=A0A6B0TM89_9RHOB|nr:LuxR family transcriptional regulator [Oceanomicrobium pacificus]MXU65680.1 hypothetical protein [Oceanomicrobium pacificus]